MTIDKLIHATHCRVEQDSAATPDLDCVACLAALGIKPHQVMHPEAILVRREILNDSDTVCSGCGAALPADFIDNAEWFADIVILPGHLEAVVKCPTCW